MMLTIGGDRIIRNPSGDDIRGALESLDGSAGDAFAILGPDDMTYIQAGGDRHTGFDLEYQEGSVDRHYRAQKDDISLDEIVQAFIRYRDGWSDWKVQFRFERITW